MKIMLVNHYAGIGEMELPLEVSECEREAVGDREPGHVHHLSNVRGRDARDVIGDLVEAVLEDDGADELVVGRADGGGAGDDQDAGLGVAEVDGGDHRARGSRAPPGRRTRGAP